MIETQTYSRKSFDVQAVQVTKENLAEIAEWCGGERHHRETHFFAGPQSFIVVPVRKPSNPRQTMAFIGDWILQINKSFRVYTPLAFERSFELKEKSIISTPIACPGMFYGYGSLAGEPSGDRVFAIFPNVEDSVVMLAQYYSDIIYFYIGDDE